MTLLWLLLCPVLPEVESEQSVTVKCTIGELSATKTLAILPVTEKSLTLTGSNLLENGASYSGCNGDHTVGDFTFTTTDICVQSGNLQFKKNSGTLTVKTSGAASITSITLPTNKLTVIIGTETVTGVQSGNNYVYTATTQATTFTIKNATTGACQLASIVIDYLA